MLPEQLPQAISHVSFYPAPQASGALPATECAEEPVDDARFETSCVAALRAVR